MSKKTMQLKETANNSNLAVHNLELSKISENPKNSRQTFFEDEMTTLRESMREVGLNVPIKVRPMKDGTYQVIYGARRFRCAKELGWEDIPAIVEDMTDEQVRTANLLENLNRADIHPYEEGWAFREAIESGQYTYNTLSKALGISLPTVYQRVKYTNLIPEFAKIFVAGEIKKGIAKIICQYPESSQKDAYKKHYAPDATNTWRGFTPELTERSFAGGYSNDLGGCPMLHESCKGCKNNTGTEDTSQRPADWSCLDPECFYSKIAGAVYAKAKALADQYPGIIICDGNDNHPDVVDRLTEEGYTVVTDDTDFEWLAPDVPAVPDETRYSDPEDYRLAMQEYQNDRDEYEEEIREHEQAVTDGEEFRWLSITPLDVSLEYSYVYDNEEPEQEYSYDTEESESADAGESEKVVYENAEPEPVESEDEKNLRKCQEEIQTLTERNKYADERFSDKVNEEAIKIFRGAPLLKGELKDEEKNLVYFVLLQHLSMDARKRYGLNYGTLWDADYEKIAETLDEEMKSEIVREAIKKFLTSNTGLNFAKRQIEGYVKTLFKKDYAKVYKKFDTEREETISYNNLRIETCKKLMEELQKKINAQTDENTENTTTDKVPAVEVPEVIPDISTETIPDETGGTGTEEIPAEIGTEEIPAQELPGTGEVGEQENAGGVGEPEQAEAEKEPEPEKQKKIKSGKGKK